MKGSEKQNTSDNRKGSVTSVCIFTSVVTAAITIESAAFWF